MGEVAYAVHTLQVPYGKPTWASMTDNLCFTRPAGKMKWRSSTCKTLERNRSGSDLRPADRTNLVFRCGTLPLNLRPVTTTPPSTNGRTRSSGQKKTTIEGCHIRDPVPAGIETASTDVLNRLGLADLQPWVNTKAGMDEYGPYVALRLNAQQAHQWAPGMDPLGLAATMPLDSLAQVEALTREIVVAMLMSPIGFEFPRMEVLVSAVRVRIQTVQAARKTALAFPTSEAARPTEFWRYDEDRVFVIRPGVCLCRALIRTTQPDATGATYAFSCYRASEYVFLHEQGTMETPLPPHLFVLGDRTWFRNPDEGTADASGDEGSWVMYLGGGLFNNFWKTKNPYTLTEKCLEIDHWRNGLYKDAEGEQRIDEEKVAPHVALTKTHASEFARWVHPHTTDLVLPTH